MCKSVKGAAYFGSSVHIVAAFVFLFWFLFDTVITEVHINLWKCLPIDDDPPRKYNLLVHYLNLPFKFLYYMSLCITGIYIFRGVERNSPLIIKFALLVFVIVQVVSLAIFITISFNYWDDPENNKVSDDETLPIASRLVNPIHFKNIPQPTDPGSTSYYEESDENGSYSINIEVFSHDPYSNKPEPQEGHHSHDHLGAIHKQNVPVMFESANTNEQKDHDDSKNSDSEPENLVLVPKLLRNNDTDEPFGDPQHQNHLDSSKESKDVIRILQGDGREFLTFPSAPQSMLLEPDSSLSTSTSGPETELEEKNYDEDAQVTAVLESPFDVDTTTPMPNVVNDKRENRGTSNKNGVVPVKIKNREETPKLSHNQLVSLVFQVFLVGFNAVGSCIYTAVLIVHLTSL